MYFVSETFFHILSLLSLKWLYGILSGFWNSWWMVFGDYIHDLKLLSCVVIWSWVWGGEVCKWGPAPHDWKLKGTPSVLPRSPFWVCGRDSFSGYMLVIAKEGRGQTHGWQRHPCLRRLGGGRSWCPIVPWVTVADHRRQVTNSRALVGWMPSSTGHMFSMGVFPSSPEHIHMASVGLSIRFWIFPPKTITNP